VNYENPVTETSDEYEVVWMKPKIVALLHSSSINGFFTYSSNSNGNIKIHSFSRRFSVEDDC
jgi:hypothetical protein